MRISDWSSDVCSSDLDLRQHFRPRDRAAPAGLAEQEAPFPIADSVAGMARRLEAQRLAEARHEAVDAERVVDPRDEVGRGGRTRSEEHTSELQSLMRTSYAVFCLKKKNTLITII